MGSACCPVFSYSPGPYVPGVLEFCGVFAAVLESTGAPAALESVGGVVLGCAGTVYVKVPCTLIELFGNTPKFRQSGTL